jgi:ADP-ribose pyrophosphatase YjhB (NUDIX family)
MIDPQPIGTCAIITNSQNQVLLGKRKNSYKAGMYGLPGGRIELNKRS